MVLNQGPSVQLEVLHLVVKLIVFSFAMRLLHLLDHSLLGQVMGPAHLNGWVISHLADVVTNVAVFVHSSILVH